MSAIGEARRAVDELSDAAVSALGDAGVDGNTQARAGRINQRINQRREKYGPPRNPDRR